MVGYVSKETVVSMGLVTLTISQEVPNPFPPDSAKSKIDKFSKIKLGEIEKQTAPQQSTAHRMVTLQGSVHRIKS